MTNKFINYCQICVVVITLLLMTSSWAQRPSFAGSRPPNGLNQKDKYHPTTQPSADIANRFGSADVTTITNQIPFGQPQRPPVGYPVVLPQPSYTPLTPTQSILPNNNNASVVFEDRFGNTNSNNFASTLPYSSSSTPLTTQRPVVPIDAHGDKLLIDRLNQTPIDQRPFWFINYLAIEAQRNATLNNSTSA